MFVVGRIERDSEYNEYCGLTNIRLFNNREMAIRFIHDNLDVRITRVPDVMMPNPEWRIWFNTSFLNPDRTVREEARRLPRPDSMLPNPNPRPYTVYVISNPWALLETGLDDVVPEAITRNENNKEINNSLYTFEECRYEILDEQPRNEEEWV